ncbi:MAG TPA: GMC family oxidoreductase [Verrucomicrobiae bacterium]|jgi:choline dehydrogenase-like flavoprotein
MSTDLYDVIIIGTGAGGGALAQRLARSGKRILILERGTFLPQEKENWDTKSVFLENRYHTDEIWQDSAGKPLHPQTAYWVGGNTKVYGAALFRLRERDFETVQHEDGISPEWPLKYRDYESYYDQAEQLYQAHGERGTDPTEPPARQPYPHPPVSHEPRIQEIYDGLAAGGYYPFPCPVGIKLNEQLRWQSQCIRCDTCDGFPCLVKAKSDADINCIRPIFELPNVTLLTGAYVSTLKTNASGTEITAVEIEFEPGKRKETFAAHIVVVACGAINSAALLLRSFNHVYPTGLANRSDLVGRNFMFHKAAIVLAIGLQPNDSKYMKTIAVNDFYFGEKEYPYPMGGVQLVGSFKWEMLKGEAPPLTPPLVLKTLKSHAVPWWLTTEDLPSHANRVRWIAGKGIQLDYTPNNQQPYERLIHRWKEVLRKVDGGHAYVPEEFYLKKAVTLEGVGHQNGTCRFGPDPKTSVLNLDCRTHDIDNLYIVDGSFFPSCGAVNPSLTIIANALRVGDHLLERLK